MKTRFVLGCGLGVIAFAALAGLPVLLKAPELKRPEEEVPELNAIRDAAFDGKPKKARCKFHCQSVKHTEYGGQEVTMIAQYDEPLSKEDNAFSKSTPSGTFVAMIYNPALNGFYVPGKDYYIDVTPAGE